MFRSSEIKVEIHEIKNVLALSTVRPPLTSCDCNKPLLMDGSGEISNLTPSRLASGEQIPHVLLWLSVPWQHICYYVFVANLDWSEVMQGTLHSSNLLASSFSMMCWKKKIYWWIDDLISYCLSVTLASVATGLNSCRPLFVLLHFFPTNLLSTWPSTVAVCQFSLCAFK